MGRAERRKAGDKQKVKTYVMTEEQLTAMVQRNVEAEVEIEREEIRRKAIDEAFAYLMAIPIVILRDKFGFGKIRLDRFKEHLSRWIRIIHTDEGTLKELIHIARDECGYVIQGYKYDYPEGQANEH